MNEYSEWNATFLSLKPCQIFLRLTVIVWTNHNCPLERKHFSGWCWEPDEPMTLAPPPLTVQLFLKGSPVSFKAVSTSWTWFLNAGRTRFILNLGDKVPKQIFFVLFFTFLTFNTFLSLFFKLEYITASPHCVKFLLHMNQLTDTQTSPCWASLHTPPQFSSFLNRNHGTDY